MMIPGKITNALKGIGGEYELNRLVGFFGGMVYFSNQVVDAFFVRYLKIAFVETADDRSCRLYGL